MRLPSLPARRIGAAISMISGLTLFACAAAQGTNPFANYYPSKAGTQWTYSNGETQIIGPAVTHRGVKVVPVSHQYGSTTYTQDLLEFRADGSVWLRGVNAAGRLTWYTPPLNIYPPAPLAPGMKWASTTGNLKNQYTVTGIQPLKLPGGTFNALVIRTDTTVGGRMSSQVSYFVPAKGVVRYETADGSVINLLR